MCGITGVINFNSSDHASRETVMRMTDVLTHRGPDEEGIWTEGSKALGFRRLSVIDLSSNANQPIFNEANDIISVFNGEIYNFKDIRRTLIKKGHVFKSKTDSEIIVHAYEEYGLDCLKYFNGMFAFALVDLKKNLLFMARDRLGIKPLYYSISDKNILFGSELKSIKVSGLRSLKLDSYALNLYLTREVVPAPFTIYKGINKLRAGEYLTANWGGATPKFNVSKYWQLDFEPDRQIKEHVWAEQIESMLSESVDCQMVSDVPLGAFLSGGIDSSSIVSLMSSNSSDPIKTFTAGFNQLGNDETEAAKATSNYFRTTHHSVAVDADSISVLKKIVNHFDEPFGDSSAIPTYLITKEASNHVTVALSGDGGDELFGGYFSRNEIMKIRAAKLAPQMIAKYIPINNLYLPYKLQQKINRLKLPNWLLFSSLHSHIYDNSRPHALQPDWRVPWDSILSSYDSLHASVAHLEPINVILATFFETYLPDDILTKVDRTSSAHSLEVRVPLLDHRIAELSAKIPPEFKFRDNTNKYIFKKAMSSRLPSSIMTRRKQGFNVPIKEWSQGVWKKELMQNRNNFPDLERIIDFSQVDSWDGTLVWQILFLSEFLIADGVQSL